MSDSLASQDHRQGPFEAGAHATLEAFAAEALDWPAVRELLADHALSSLGRRYLAELLPRPTGGVSGARAALARCGELLERCRDAGRAPADRLPPLAGVTDPEPLLDAARTYSRPFDEDEFRVLAVFLRAVQKLSNWVTVRGHELAAHVELLSRLPDLVPLIEDLDRSLDDRGRVLDEASPALAKLRGEIERLAAEIERVVARGDLAAAAGWLDACKASVHAESVEETRRGRRVRAALEDLRGLELLRAAIASQVGVPR